MNYDNPKICFVIVWYGTLPDYFQMFANSILGKPFHILFISSNPKPQYVPDNFKWVKMEWNTLMGHFENKLNTPIKIYSSYKLCDFKPAFGHIFSDYLALYEFWGCLDIDMVIGNIANYLTEERLDNLDFFSGLKYYVAGSFFFMRNTPAHNKLFMKSRSWQEVMARSDMVSFTECNKYWHQLNSGANLLSLNTPIESFTEVLLREKELGMGLYFENIVLEPKGMEAVAIKENGIFYQNREYLLLHLLYFKTRQKFTCNIRHNISPYYINAFGTFRRKPDGFGFWLAPNWIVALYRKIIIQWEKLFPPRIISENAT